MDQFKVADALEEVMKALRQANKYIDETAPWVLAKENKMSIANLPPSVIVTNW